MRLLCGKCGSTAPRHGSILVLPLGEGSKREQPWGVSEINVNSSTSTSRGRGRLLVLAVAVLAVLTVAVWVLVATGGSDQSAADTADRASSPATVASQSPRAEPSPPRPSDPPTAMPDGSPIPTPRLGAPDTIGEGKTEAAAPVSIKPAVGLDETGDFGTGLTVQLTDIEAVQGVARAPGEIAGPALEVTVEAVNESTEAVSLDGVIVFLSYGEDRIPATDFGGGSAPLGGNLAAGTAATGTYVLAVPEEQRDDVRVEISYTGEAPTVAFIGSAD